MRFPHDVPRLTDGTVTLRAHSLDDIPRILEYCTDPESVRWTSIPAPYTLDDAKRYVMHIAPAAWTDGTAFEFAIDVGGVLAGGCTLRRQQAGRGEIGYVAHPDARGRGIVDRALRLLVDWGFETGGFEAIAWEAQFGNWASRKAAWKLGFSCSNRLSGWLPQRDVLHDAWAGTLRRGDPREPRNPWYDVPRISGSSVVLRPQVPEDAQRIVEAVNDPRTRAWGRFPDPFDLDEAQRFMASRQEGMALGECVHWTIADLGDDQLLGVINIFDIEHQLDGEIGFWTHPDARGRGVMTEALRLTVRHAFIPEEDGGLGMSRVTAYSAVANTSSRHVITTNGFREYGVERRGIRLGDDSVMDLACYDLLSHEWADRP